MQEQAPQVPRGKRNIDAFSACWLHAEILKRERSRLVGSAGEKEQLRTLRQCGMGD